MQQANNVVNVSMGLPFGHFFFLPIRLTFFVFLFVFFCRFFGGGSRGRSFTVTFVLVFFGWGGTTCTRFF
jgi:hypothetical protein